MFRLGYAKKAKTGHNLHVINTDIELTVECDVSNKFISQFYTWLITPISFAGMYRTTHHYCLSVRQTFFISQCHTGNIAVPNFQDWTNEGRLYDVLQYTQLPFIARIRLFRWSYTATAMLSSDYNYDLIQLDVCSCQHNADINIWRHQIPVVEFHVLGHTVWN